MKIQHKKKVLRRTIKPNFLILREKFKLNIYISINVFPHIKEWEVQSNTTSLQTKDLASKSIVEKLEVIDCSLNGKSKRPTVYNNVKKFIDWYRLRFLNG